MSRRGGVAAFLGPNGAGKSTTLRALLGLVRPSAGSATFGGVRYDEHQRARNRRDQKHDRGVSPVAGSTQP
jgi:ABC-type multidrug transport system ATPase subunit